jgi:hypothetical protein
VGVQDRRSAALVEQRSDAQHASATRRPRKDADLHARTLYICIPTALLRLRREDRFKGPTMWLDNGAKGLERRYERARVRSRKVRQVNDADPTGCSRPHRERVYCGWCRGQRDG